MGDRARLPSTFVCLAEWIRYRTIGPLAVPHMTAEGNKVGGYLIPAGA